MDALSFFLSHRRVTGVDLESLAGFEGLIGGGADTGNVSVTRVPLLSQWGAPRFLEMEGTLEPARREA